MVNAFSITYDSDTTTEQNAIFTLGRKEHEPHHIRAINAAEKSARIQWKGEIDAIVCPFLELTYLKQLFTLHKIPQEKQPPIIVVTSQANMKGLPQHGEKYLETLNIIGGIDDNAGSAKAPTTPENMWHNLCRIFSKMEKIGFTSPYKAPYFRHAFAKLFPARHPDCHRTEHNIPIAHGIYPMP